MSAARWAVFISGRGSNADALWELLAELDVRVCVSSRKKAFGLTRARRLGLEILTLDSKVQWSALTEALKARKVNRIFLLGFMKIVPAEFVKAWEGRMWNLHPSLLPAFPGLDSIVKSYEANGPMGVSIHEVTAEMDAGPLCFQYKICDKSKDEMSLAEAQMKISQTEQRLVREWALRQNGGLQKWI